jgi:hypothetical protein
MRSLYYYRNLTKYLIMKTRVQFHIENEDALVPSKVIDSPFDIIPIVDDIIRLEGEEGYFKVIKRQFMDFKINGEPWINAIAVIIKKQ